MGANGDSVLRRPRAGRGRPLVCSADAVVVAASGASPSRASVARAMRMPREPSARAKPRATTRGDFVREVMLGSRAMILRGVDVAKRGENLVRRAGVAVVALEVEAPSSNFVRPVGFYSTSVAIADADPIGVGTRKTRS